MCEWTPKLKGNSTPLYQALANALLADIASGVLKPGQRLPTHRELARKLGISIGSVTRAYREVESRKLIEAAAGRGTWVRELREGLPDFKASPTPRSLTDLSVGHPVYSAGPDLSSALEDVSRDPNAAELLRYRRPISRTRYLEAGRSWLAANEVPAKGSEIVISAGATHGFFATLLATTRPGDMILADQATYPAFLSSASLLGLNVVGVPGDGEGMDPEALEAVCQGGRPRILFLNPTYQNPTNHILPVDRREAITTIAREHNLLIIEDEQLRLLHPHPPPPISLLAPERTVFIGSLSKGTAVGLRVAFLRAPETVRMALETVVDTTLLMVPPLMVELAARWIEDGTAQETAARKGEEGRGRRSLAREILGSERVGAEPGGLYLWLQIPEGWESDGFTAEARRRGVGITQSLPFTTPGIRPHRRVRVCLGAAEDRDCLGTALEILAEIMENRPVRPPGLV